MLRQPECDRRSCLHFRGAENDGDETTERVFCAAFPDGIPNEIAYGDNLHMESYPGDNGIQYQKVDNTTKENT